MRSCVHRQTGALPGALIAYDSRSQREREGSRPAVLRIAVDWGDG